MKKGLTNQLYDEEGYAIIEFIYKNKEKDFYIPKKHLDLIKNKKLTKETILDLGYDDVLRLATHKDSAVLIKNLMGVRGVYLKNYHINPQGESNPTTIKPHQVKTLTWMREREDISPTKTFGVRGGILHLTMGLGKTLTSLVHILSSKKGTFPTLVVCSKTVMINWQIDGVSKFFGDGENAPKVLFLHKDFMKVKEINSITREDILEYDIVITSYDSCKTAAKKGKYPERCFEMGDEHSLMKGKIISVHERKLKDADIKTAKGLEVIYGTPWERVICDESQCFANPDTYTYKCMMAIYGNYKWCLTGTPIRNYETDIWAQLRFCGYNGVTRKSDWNKKGKKIFVDHDLKSSIFSMDYKEAGQKLPPKTNYLINVNLKDKQLEVYNYVLGAARKSYDLYMQKLCSFSCVLEMFTRLRQCAIAPFLMTNESKRDKAKKRMSSGKEDIDLIKEMMKDKKNADLGKWCNERDGEAGIYSSKMTEFVDTVSKLPKDSKVLVFSMFTSCLDLATYALEVRLPDFKFVQIDGDTTGEDRKYLLDQFNTQKEIRGAFFTYKVGGEGLNLTAATHCIPIEPWWTPAVPGQAVARCWRFGQTKPVFVHNIIANSTIENRIIEICNEKEAMAASYLEGTTRSMGSKMDKYTLGKILGIGK